MKQFTFFIAVLLFISCKAQPVKIPDLKINADDNTLLWQVTGKDVKGATYIFGTFHLMCKEDIHFSAALQTAVKYVDTVYMEMDMDDPATLLGGMLLMNMKDGKQLADLYSPEEYKRLNEFFKDSIKIPLTLFQKTKPMFLMAMLYPKMMPCAKVSGVEEGLMQLAKLNQKAINGFETMEFQSSVFDSIPYTTQAKELLKSIDSMASSKAYFDTMLTVYKSQRVKEIEALFSKSEFGMTENQDLLLDNRNKNWVNQLKVLMKNNNLFCAVGAGHLVGKNGLLELLRKEGYVVKPLFN